MELDELKKSWNALNEQLQKEPIADEQQITELIAGYKANTRKSLGRLVVIQRFSIGMGAVGLAALLLIWLLLPTFGDRKSTRLNSSHASKSRMPSSA